MEMEQERKETNQERSTFVSALLRFQGHSSVPPPQKNKPFNHIIRTHVTLCTCVLVCFLCSKKDTGCISITNYTKKLIIEWGNFEKPLQYG